jgi:Tfp pilus assembly protein FimT
MQPPTPGAFERRAIGTHDGSARRTCTKGRVRVRRTRERRRAYACLREDGVTLLEVLFAMALATTVSALSMSLVGQTVDEVRTASAARYVAARIGAARAAAVRSSRTTALKFEAVDGDYRFSTFADGNGNGVRAAEIRDGTDPPVEPFERLSDKFPGVRFALTEGASDADGQERTGADGVRIGAARILSMSSDGTATSGTLYIRGRRVQYAVRVLGVTGRTRMLQYRAEDDTWINR